MPFEAWPCQFRINKYPFTHEIIGSDGLKSHTDNWFLTIVQDDEILSVLEVMEKSGKFVAIYPCPGTLLVTLADIATVSELFSLYVNLKIFFFLLPNDDLTNILLE